MTVSAEVVDSAFGRPAEGVPVTLLRETEARWCVEGTSRTDEHGYAPVLPSGTTLRGRYRLVVDLDAYFAGLGVEPFQSRAELVFRVFGLNDGVHLILQITPSSILFCRIATFRNSSDSPE